MRAGGAIVAAGAFALFAVPARAAEPIPLAVTRGEAASSCPDAPTLIAAINDSAKRTLVRPDDLAAPVRLVVELARGAEGFTATIRVIGGEGVRTLADPDATCDDLAQALVVTLVVMLDEGIAARPPPPAPAPIAPPPIAPVPPRPEAPKVVASRALRFVAGVGVDAGVALAIVRTAAPYFAADFEARWIGAFRLGVGGLAIAPQRFAQPGGGSVDVSLLAARAFGCVSLFSFGRREDEAGLCGVLAAGRVRGRASGLAVNGDAALPWGAAGAMLRADGHLFGAFSWSARASLLVPWGRTAFEVDGAGRVYEPPAMAGVFGVGVFGTIG